ncbi:hypothetical protein VTL71DRAFT_12358 [Oculimacula yallundae]|uniref:Uncharacterized protein n=1 Tax=Oculimacula yallundae TaxID=86028 RepID=A0ABR4CP58_9HELO
MVTDYCKAGRDTRAADTGVFNSRNDSRYLPRYLILVGCVRGYMNRSGSWYLAQNARKYIRQTGHTGKKMSSSSFVLSLIPHPLMKAHP